VSGGHLVPVRAHLGAGVPSLLLARVADFEGFSPPKEEPAPYLEQAVRQTFEVGLTVLQGRDRIATRKPVVRRPAGV
jgi:hypothetical protein